MSNLTTMNGLQWQNLLNAISSGGGGGSSEELLSILQEMSDTLTRFKVLVSTVASDVSLDTIEGLTSDNVQDAIAELKTLLQGSNSIYDVRSEYTKIVDVLKNIETTKHNLPCSIQKAGSAQYTDLPFTPNTDEWCAVVYGSHLRMCVIVTNFANYSTYIGRWWHNDANIIWRRISVS